MSFGPHDKEGPSRSGPAQAEPQSGAPEGVPSLGGRYRALRELGRGGMGRVFAAHDLKLDREVAIKVLAPGEHDEIELRRFEQEGRAAAALNHPNVLDIHDIGTHEGTPYIVSELLQGKTLRKRLEEGPIPAPVAIDYALQLSQGLAAAHAKGIVHRDLKPENLFITDEGRVKILDFGIAKLLPAGRPEPDPALRTKTGALLGTADYMSPEQVRGRRADHRSDLFSFGSILYEMVAGRRPFGGDTMVEVGFSILNGEPAPLPPEVSPELQQILLLCLEKDPERRYASAGDLAADLQAIARSGPPAEPPRSLRSKVMLAVGTLLVVVLALEVVRREFADRAPDLPRPPPSPITLLIADFENATADPVFDGTLEPVLAIALEGASFVNAYKRHDALKIAATQLKRDASKLDEATAQLVAIREGLGAVVSGSIRKSRQSYSLSVSAIEPRGKVIVMKTVDAGNKADVLPALGKLATAVRSALGDTSPQSGQAAAIETFTAASIDAAHEYAQAQELQHRGESEAAVAHYEKALALDPDLGRAYSGLAAVNMNLRRREQAEKYFQLALARIDRMTERERFRTRGLYYLFLRDYEKAAEEYRALVKQYPADVVGFVNLAVAHCYRRDMAAALDAGGRALKIMPGHLLNRSNLAVYALYSGDFESAAREARTVQDASPSYTTPRVVSALAAIGSGHPEQAAPAYQALAPVSRSGATLAAQGVADLALYRGRPSEAVAILQTQIPADLEYSPSAAANELLTLAAAKLSLGRAAEAEAERALALSKADATLFGAARIHLAAGNEKKARALAAELGGRRVREPQAYAKIIEGEAQLIRGDSRGAIQTLREAQQILDTWIGHYVLGRAYLDDGAWLEAHEEFGICLKRRGESSAIFVDEVPSFRYLPAVYYYLGRAQEHLKSPAAAESYRAFVSIKENAEGAEPLLEDARRRLAAR